MLCFCNQLKTVYGNLKIATIEFGITYNTAVSCFHQSSSFSRPLKLCAAVFVYTFFFTVHTMFRNLSFMSEKPEVLFYENNSLGFGRLQFISAQRNALKTVSSSLNMKALDNILQLFL